MVVSGLTGGIATGKSTVAGMLKSAGAVIVDADTIARGVVKKGLPAWEKIVNHFGREVLLPDGELNRAHLGNIIFNNPVEKENLNQMVHPFVFGEIDNQMEQIEKTDPDAVVIQDIPLLMELKLQDQMPEVILVYIPEHLQIERLMARDGLSEMDALSRIRSQMPIEAKKTLATIVIDNSSTLERTRQRTLEVYRKLKNKRC